MDDDFYKERAKHIRQIAIQADPFIKKRLLRLASNYDAMIFRKIVPSTPSDESADNPPGPGRDHDVNPK